LWGLLIVSTGGFRFHHFPHESWMDALSRIGCRRESPKEKIIFIPKDRLLSAEFKTERSWWKRLFSPSPPLLTIRCLTDGNVETVLTAETEIKALELADRIRELMQKSGSRGKMF
jgi:hypothetical protein